MNYTSGSDIAQNQDQEITKQVHETVLLSILALLAFVLAPLTVASNLLVIAPFCRFARVRTASNQILLALAITDLLLGLVLFMASFTGVCKITQLTQPQSHMHISYAVGMAMSTLQATSLMLMTANSGDKALSLLRPLHYSEIVTFASVNAYITFALLMSIIIGVVVPLTLNPTWSQGDFANFMIIPLGPTPEVKMQIGLLIFFTLPCGLIVTFCHVYVYTVANRHANAIKRDNSVRERMMTSASYKLTTTSEAVVFGMEAAARTNNYLTIPMNSGGDTTTKAKKVRSNSTWSLRKGSDSSQASQNTKATARYGASLLLGVVVVFFSRMPSELWPLFCNSHKGHRGHRQEVEIQLLYLVANIPLFLCSTFNPWMYAYHNLDLKPVMQRLLKRNCKGLAFGSASNHTTHNYEDQSNYRSYLTNWQFSVFATFSAGRRSSWHTAQPGSAAQVSQVNGRAQVATLVLPLPVSNSTQQIPTRSRCQSGRSKSRRRRSSAASLVSKVKTRRSKSCTTATGRAIPTVTVWDGDSPPHLSRPEEML